MKAYKLWGTRWLTGSSLGADENGGSLAHMRLKGFSLVEGWLVQQKRRVAAGRRICQMLPCFFTSSSSILKHTWSNAGHVETIYFSNTDFAIHMVKNDHETVKCLLSYEVNISIKSCNITYWINHSQIQNNKLIAEITWAVNAWRCRTH